MNKRKKELLIEFVDNECEQCKSKTNLEVHRIRGSNKSKRRKKKKIL